MTSLLLICYKVARFYFLQKKITHWGSELCSMHHSVNTFSKHVQCFLNGWTGSHMKCSYERTVVRGALSHLVILWHTLCYASTED